MEIWYPILICLYVGSRISYRKVFVLQTKLCIPPFQWIMSNPSSMFVAREIKQKLPRKFNERFFASPFIFRYRYISWNIKYFNFSLMCLPLFSKQNFCINFVLAVSKSAGHGRTMWQDVVHCKGGRNIPIASINFLKDWPQ